MARTRKSFEKKYGPEVGPRLVRALQQKSSASGKVEKIMRSRRPSAGPLRRTTLDMDPELWKALKMRAVEEGRPMRALLLAALTDYLKRPKGGVS